MAGGKENIGVAVSKFKADLKNIRPEDIFKDLKSKKKPGKETKPAKGTEPEAEDSEEDEGNTDE